MSRPQSAQTRGKQGEWRTCYASDPQHVPQPLLVPMTTDGGRKPHTCGWLEIPGEVFSSGPSGLLPSVLMRPDGSFVQGVSAFVRALHTKSLTAKCLADLPADCLQTSPWWPLGSAVSPH